MCTLLRLFDHPLSSRLLTVPCSPSQKLDLSCIAQLRLTALDSLSAASRLRSLWLAGMGEGQNEELPAVIRALRRLTYLDVSNTGLCRCAGNWQRRAAAPIVGIFCPLTPTPLPLLLSLQVS